MASPQHRPAAVGPVDDPLMSSTGWGSSSVPLTWGFGESSPIHSPYYCHLINIKEQSS